MLKKILFTSALIGSSLFNITYAAPATDASVQQAIELSHVNQMMTESLTNLGKVFDQQAVQMVQKRTGHQTLNLQEQKAAQDIGQIIKDSTSQLIQQANMPSLISQIFKKYYSEEELQVLIKFLSTPEGQSINKKQPLVVQETMQNMINIFSNPQTKVDQQKRYTEIDSILKSLPKESKEK